MKPYTWDFSKSKSGSKNSKTIEFHSSETLSNSRICPVRFRAIVDGREDKLDKLNFETLKRTDVCRGG